MQNGDGTFPRLWEELRSAQRSITLQLYYGAPGRMADTLGDILRDRAKAGVGVFVLYDAFGTVSTRGCRRRRSGCHPRNQSKGFVERARVTRLNLRECDSTRRADRLDELEWLRADTVNIGNVWACAGTDCTHAHTTKRTPAVRRKVPGLMVDTTICTGVRLVERSVTPSCRSIAASHLNPLPEAHDGPIRLRDHRGLTRAA